MLILFLSANYIQYVLYMCLLVLHVSKRLLVFVIVFSFVYFCSERLNDYGEMVYSQMKQFRHFYICFLYIHTDITICKIGKPHQKYRFWNGQ